MSHGQRARTQTGCSLEGVVLEAECWEVLGSVVCRVRGLGFGV